jgi:hypothetical protein
MATTLTMSGLSMRAGWSFQKTVDWGVIGGESSYAYSKSLSDGAAVDNVNRLYVAQGELAASATLALDLAGSLTDIFGATITFARVKVFFLQLTTATAGTKVTVGGNTNAAMAGSDGFFAAANDKVRVKRDGALMVVDPTATGYPVTAATGDILDIINEDSGAAVTYKLAIAGAAT